jgi:hypothetical protein
VCNISFVYFLWWKHCSLFNILKTYQVYVMAYYSFRRTPNISLGNLAHPLKFQHSPRSSLMNSLFGRNSCSETSCISVCMPGIFLGFKRKFSLMSFLSYLFRIVFVINRATLTSVCVCFHLRKFFSPFHCSLLFHVEFPIWFLLFSFIFLFFYTREKDMIIIFVYKISGK